MKWKLILLLAAIILSVGFIKATDETRYITDQSYTVCIMKENLTKKKAKSYKKYGGICLQRVDGRGYACVVKEPFQKANCAGVKASTLQEVQDAYKQMDAKE